MKKQILKYTIRTHKKDNNLIEIFVRDYPSIGCEFTCFCADYGHSAASGLYYARNTRPATTNEIKKLNENGTLKIFKELCSNDYELQYLKRLPR